MEGFNRVIRPICITLVCGAINAVIGLLVGITATSDEVIWTIHTLLHIIDVACLAYIEAELLFGELPEQRPCPEDWILIWAILVAIIIGAAAIVIYLKIAPTPPVVGFIAPAQVGLAIATLLIMVEVEKRRKTVTPTK